MDGEQRACINTHFPTKKFNAAFIGTFMLQHFRLQTNLLVAPCPTYSEHIIRDYRCAHLVVCASLSGVHGINRRSLCTFHSQILFVTILVFCVYRFSFLGNLWLPPTARGWLEQICANDFLFYGSLH